MAHGQRRHFFKAFLSNPTKIGAIAPSSRALARVMVKGIRLHHDEAIIEFGPGTGPVTAEIAKVLPSPKSYLGIERDTKFVQVLRKRFPKLAFVEGSAEHADQYCHKAAVGKIKAIVSGLPFASLPVKVQDNIVQTLIKLLPEGGEFRTFQYIHAYQMPNAARFRKRMARLLGRHKRSRAVLANLPPAYVLTWHKPVRARLQEVAG